MIVCQDRCVQHLRSDREIRTFQDNCSNIISVAVRKYPAESNLGEKVFTLAHSFLVSSIIVGKSRQWGLETVISYPQSRSERKQSIQVCSPALFPYALLNFSTLAQLRIHAQRMMLLILGWSTLIKNYLQANPQASQVHSPSLRVFPQVILGSVKLTLNVTAISTDKSNSSDPSQHCRQTGIAHPWCLP